MSATSQLRDLKVRLLVTGRADAEAMTRAVRGALDEAAFPHLGTDTLAGTAGEIRAAMERVIHVDPHDLIIVASPVDLSHPVRADRVVLEDLETPLPGIGEALRAFAAEQAEPEAWLLPTGGGARNGALVLVVPARPEFFELAWHLILGPMALAALASIEGDTTVELESGPSAELRLPAPPEASSADGDGSGLRSGVGVTGVQVGRGEAPEEDPDEPVSSWQQALDDRGATRVQDAWPTLPEAFERIAAARDVLDGAGERGVVELESGERCAIYGFPDLQRRGSKVLLVRDAYPLPEVVALHRHPRPVGVLTSGDDGLLPSADLLPDPLSEERTGRTTPSGGFLFALEQDAVYLDRSSRIYRWDGRRETEMGTPKQAYASLVLKWSQQ